MKLTEKTVKDVAALAALNLTDGEIEQMQTDLGDVLDLMEILDGIDTEGVEPISQVLFEGESTLRDDVARRSLSNDEALSNAPESGYGYFKVPRALP